jgi:DNA repair exonuclease SbcCD ATPase subunit
MKVVKLHLENFRIHADSTLAFEGNSFVVIRGSNFAGKSTIGQALSMCLTPSTTGLDPRGWGFASKIKRGESKAVITADLQTKRHLIQRTVTLNPAVRSQKTVCLSDPGWSTGRFDSELEKQRAALTVVLNTDAFLRMDEKEQKNLLAGLALPSRYDFPPLTIAEVETVLGPNVINFEGEPFAVINLAYKKLFDERQIVNRQVKEFYMPEALPVPAGVDSGSLQEELTALRERRRVKQHERDLAVADAGREEQARVYAKAKIEADIANESRRESTIRERLLKEGQLGYLRKIAESKPELDRLEKEREGAARLHDQCRARSKALEAVPWNAKECPTCEQPVEQEKLKKLGERLKRELTEANNALGLIEQKIMALGEVEEAIELIAKHNAALAELGMLDQQAPERQKKIEQAKSDLPGPTLFDFAPFNESLGEIDAEIERLSGQLRPVIVAEERRKEIDVKRQQLAVLKEKAATLDHLVKYFDKGGVKAKLIGDYIGGFEGRLNEVMSAWGYSVALSIEPYSFDVTNARGDTNPVRELSGAEKVMFSLAFQCAVAMTANLGLVVIDEVAMFLPELRPILNRRLWEMLQKGHLEQVILLVADTSEETPRLPGAVFYMVDNGEVRPLPKNGATRKETQSERRSEHRSIA